MTAARAHRINGLTYEQRGPKEWVALDDAGGVVASASHRKPEKALKELVEVVYAQNRVKAMERDGWRCVRCGSFRNLQAHHKVERGMGGANRDDRVGNLETICHEDHARIHGG